MNAFAANLKTFYQCRGLWFWHAVGALFVIEGVLLPVIRPVTGEGAFMKFLVVSIWLGMVAASMMKETLTRPQTFGLPGHQETVRSVLFAIGVAQALILSLIVLAYPGLSAGATLGGMASLAFGAMTFYLLSVHAMFRLGNAAAFWGVPVLFLGLFRHVFTEVRVAIESALLFHPWANAVVLLAVGPPIWFWLGSRKLARTQCGSSFMPMQSLFDRQVTDRYGRERRLRYFDRYGRRLWRVREMRFLSKMGRLPAYSARRYSRGSLYATLGNVWPVSPLAVISSMVGVVVFLAILGFAPSPESHGGSSRANFLFILPAIVGVVTQLPIYSTLLVPGGRPERFRACLSIGVRAAGVALVLSGALYFASTAIGALIPEITVAGSALGYRSMDPGLSLVTLLLVPLLFTCQVVSPRNSQIGQTVILITATVFGMAAPGIFQGALIPIVAVTTVLTWCLFVGMLHDACHRGDLASG